MQSAAGSPAAERRLKKVQGHTCRATTATSCATAAAAATDVALIVGAGPGISAACARRFRKEGMDVAVAARTIDKPAIATLVEQHGCLAFPCDAADPASVDGLFAAVADAFGRAPTLVVYNPSGRAKGPIETLDPIAVRDSLLVSAFGAFLVAQAAARAMLSQQNVRGSILFTGASASYKGFANSSSFAMGSFGRLLPTHELLFTVLNALDKFTRPLIADRALLSLPPSPSLSSLPPALFGVFLLFLQPSV